MNAVHFVLAMAWRESRAAGRKLALLTAAISIGVGALVAIDSFTDNLERSVDEQSRGLMGADLSVSTRTKPTTTLERLLDSLTAAIGVDRLADRADVTSFSAMGYVTRTAGARLVQVSAIRGSFPFYGEIRTEPAGVWSRLPEARQAYVDPSLLTLLGAHHGDTLALGESRFVIAGTVLNYPGDVGIRAALGPRVFIPGQYLEETRLLGFGSRAEFEFFFRLSSGADPKAIAKRFRPLFAPEHARLRTVEEDQRDLKTFFEQLGRYLGLAALVALLLGGIGVGSAVQVFIKQKRETVAVLRCLGASSRRVFAVYLLQAAGMGLLGSTIGVLFGIALQLALPAVLGDFLPLDVRVSPSVRAVFTGLGVGLWVSTVFALLPLLAIRQIAPLAVLRRPFEEESQPTPRDAWHWFAAIGLVVSVIGLAILQVGDFRRGAAFSAGVGGALLILWLAARGLIRGLRRRFPRGLPYVWRQGLANLYRPSNQTVAVVLALGFGGFLLCTLAVIQHNLLRSLNFESGVGRPNLVFFDIQPDQHRRLDSLLGASGLHVRAPVPIVPMRIISVKGRLTKDIMADTANTTAPGERRGRDGGPQIGRWALRREYRSTYRDTTVASEKLIAGRWLADLEPGRQADSGAVPISIEVSVAAELGVTLGDEIVWDVQGVQIRSRVTSMREVNWARFEPNFYVVFPTSALQDAPKTLVTLTRVDDPIELGRVQRRVAELFPNITSIDMSFVQRTVERIIGRVSLAIRFMALFTLATGAVVLIGAVATSRYQRLREAVLLRTLGATRGQVVRVLISEYAALGGLASVVAVGLSTVAGWALMKWVFEIRFTLPFPQLFGLTLGLIALTVTVGLWNSTEIFRKAPLEVLREE
jgi:putative ABC transport system permease protein